MHFDFLLVKTQNRCTSFLVWLPIYDFCEQDVNLLLVVNYSMYFVKLTLLHVLLLSSYRYVRWWSSIVKWHWDDTWRMSNIEFNNSEIILNILWFKTLELSYKAPYRSVVSKVHTQYVNSNDNKRFFKNIDRNWTTKSVSMKVFRRGKGAIISTKLVI